MKPAVFFSAVAAAVVIASYAVVYATREYPRAAPSSSTPTVDAAPAETAPPEPPFEPPPIGAIADDAFGRQVLVGRAIFNGESALAAPYVGNALRCSSCHLDEGRLPNSAPLWAAYVAYPESRGDDGQVSTFTQRLQRCFRYSLNGKAPPADDPVIVALQSYAFFLARGAATGAALPGRGYLQLPKPPVEPDRGRGRAVYDRSCALCHGADGKGQTARGQTVFPPLWGPDSFNWGSGMSSIANLAGFIKANMPLGRPDSLSLQAAWDVALFVGSHDRPQDPRFDGSVDSTRERFHSDGDMYGREVDGVVLRGLPAQAR